MENIVRVGVGLYILNEKKQVLLGLRKSKHGEGTWSAPGGHLEFGESFEEAAARETKEETGLNIDKKDIKIIGTTNDFYKESNKHYITIHMMSNEYFGDIKITEQGKWEKWEWFELDKLPENMFLSSAKFLKEKTLFLCHSRA